MKPKSPRRKRGRLWATLYLRLFGEIETDESENEDGEYECEESDREEPER
jgi:hypothetical protein